MTTYILFIYAMFDDMEEIEYYCKEVLSQNPAVKKLKFVVENAKNLIVIIDSEFSYKELSNTLHGDLMNENVKFYFMFNRDEVVSAHIPMEVRDFMFSTSKEETETYIFVQYDKKNRVVSLDLDEVLDKIKKEGIESLTTDEKKFLDSFDN